MKAMNEMKLIFPSRSANEGLARSAVASFISQLDPAVDELIDVPPPFRRRLPTALFTLIPTT